MIFGFGAAVVPVSRGRRIAASGPLRTVTLDHRSDHRSRVSGRTSRTTLRQAMRPVPERLSEARCQLFPVQWEEPSGMVMIEAMVYGPVTMSPGSATGTRG